MLRLDRHGVRSWREQVTLALVLAFVGGAVDASGLLGLGGMTSHMSGNSTHLGLALAVHPVEALAFARLVAAFLLGAFASTLAIPMLRRWVREPVGGMLLIEAGLLVAVGEGPHLALSPSRALEALCLAMGWQNALITTISGAVVRTTHVTGTVTDLGIGLGHLASTPPRTLWRSAQTLWREDGAASDLSRVVLHGSIVCAFVLGATAGPLLFVRFGERGLFAPALALVVLVIVDLGRRTRAAAVPTA